MDNPAPFGAAALRRAAPRSEGATIVRPTIEALPASRIREVANAGIGRSDILKFWFGEGDQVTPAFIRDAAKAALDAGDTFYNHNLGLIDTAVQSLDISRMEVGHFDRREAIKRPRLARRLSRRR